MRMSRKWINRTWCSRKILEAAHNGLPRWLQRPSRLRATPQRTARLDGRNENAEIGEQQRLVRCRSVVTQFLLALSSGVSRMRDTLRKSHIHGCPLRGQMQAITSSPTLVNLSLLHYVCVATGRRHWRQQWSASRTQNLCVSLPKVCTSRRVRYAVVCTA